MIEDKGNEGGGRGQEDGYKEQAGKGEDKYRRKNKKKKGKAREM